MHPRTMCDQPRPRARDPMLIKRYAGSRLYNTATATYVSFGDLSQMVLDGIRFVVRDAESDADITRIILDRSQ